MADGRVVSPIRDCGGLKLVEVHDGYDLERRLLDLAKGTPCVYFMRSREFVKIGWSGNLRVRLSEVRSANPLPVRLIGIMGGGREAERLVHKRLWKHHLRAEWFKLEPPVVKVLRAEGCWPYIPSGKVAIYPAIQPEQS